MTSKDNPRVFVPPPLMLAAFVVVGLLIDGGPMATGLVLAAAMIVGLAGLGLIASALGLFFRSKTRPEPWRGASFLVAAGPYRFTRNPMYLGMILIGLAVALAFSSIAAALLSLLAAPIVDRIVIRREEAYLTRRFGEDYRAYREKVRRWL
jgi:protein-S-isoprenylcysteine O-methyltransferase Ste14